MRKFPMLCSLLLLASTGCQTVFAPTVGVVYNDTKWNAGVTSNEKYGKSASGEALSIFGFVAMGDISADTLAKKASITKIHHLDVRTRNILGIGILTATIYGD